MPDPALEREQYFDQYAQPLPTNQGFNDPAYQQRTEQQMIDIYRRAQNVKQAEADVSSARRMLGIIKADREVQQGKPIDRAMYDNINYFVNPGDRNFAGAMQQLRPVPPPYTTNFPGMTAPVVIAPTRSGQTVHFPPSSVLPQSQPPRQISAIPVINADGSTNANLVATPAAGGKGVVVHSVKTPQEGSLTEVQKARLRELDIADREARNISFTGDRDATLQQIKAERQLIYGGNKQPQRIRVREKSSGKLGWWEGSDALPSDYEKVE